MKQGPTHDVANRWFRPQASGRMPRHPASYVETRCEGIGFPAMGGRASSYLTGFFTPAHCLRGETSSPLHDVDRRSAQEVP